MSEIKHNSDIGVICPKCGAVFTGQAKYHNELIAMFNDHSCERPLVKIKADITPFEFESQTNNGERNEEA